MLSQGNNYQSNSPLSVNPYILQSLYICVCNVCVYVYLSVMCPKIFWGDRGQQGVWRRERGCDAPLWFQGKALVGTRRQSSRTFQRFITLKSLLINIYLPHPVMKLI